MLENTTSPNQQAFDKLSRLYIIALSTIAVSVIISKILVYNHLHTQSSNSTTIKYTGR